MIKDWFYVGIRITSHGRFTDRIKRVPRVRLHCGFDHSFMDMMTIGVYWSPRNPCSQGEYLYNHWIKFSWRKLFHFDWR